MKMKHPAIAESVREIVAGAEAMVSAVSKAAASMGARGGRAQVRKGASYLKPVEQRRRALKREAGIDPAAKSARARKAWKTRRANAAKLAEQP